MLYEFSQLLKDVSELRLLEVRGRRVRGAANGLLGHGRREARGERPRAAPRAAQAVRSGAVRALLLRT